MLGQKKEFCALHGPKLLRNFLFKSGPVVAQKSTLIKIKKKAKVWSERQNVKS